MVAGTTGEGSTLTDEEHRQVLKFAVDKIAGRVPVIAGTGSNDTSYAIDLTKYACSIGADAMLLAKNVDAIYSDDPKKNPNAIRYSHLTYDEVIERELKATDLTAITLCKEQNIPILAFAMADPDNVVKAVQGESIGTLIDNVK